MTFDDHEIILPPRPPKRAYLIDPGFSTSRTYDDIGEPCRVDGEVDGGEVWKWNCKHLLARVIHPFKGES